jgi:hypothetical protein
LAGWILARANLAGVGSGCGILLAGAALAPILFFYEDPDEKR